MSSQKKEPTGFMAYVVAARELRASSAHRKCLIQYYTSNVGSTGSFFKSMLDICTDTCLSENFVRKINIEWQKAGLITWGSGSNLTGKANTYQIDLHKLQVAAKQSMTKKDAIKKAVKDKAAVKQAAYRAKAKHDTQLLAKYVTSPHAVTK